MDYTKKKNKNPNKQTRSRRHHKTTKGRSADSLVGKKTKRSIYLSVQKIN